MAEESSVPMFKACLNFHCCCLFSKTYLTLCNPMDCNPLGSSVRGISQARILEWVAFPSSGDLPNPGIESFVSCIAGGFFTTEPLCKLWLWFLLSLKTKTCLICGHFTLRREGSPPDKDCYYPGDIPGVVEREREWRWGPLGAQTICQQFPNWSSPLGIEGTLTCCPNSPRIWRISALLGRSWQNCRSLGKTWTWGSDRMSS